MADFLSQLADIQIDRATRTPSQVGFGRPLVAAYHTKNADRVRSYADVSELVADGFNPYDRAYQLVAAMLSQEPAPPVVSLGRRALAFTQVVDLTPAAAPAIGDVTTAKIDGLTATFTATATTIANVCTGLAAAINALGVVNAIVATGASSASEQTLAGASLDGASGSASLGQPRNITFTFSAHANWDATTATLNGLDGNGAAQTESISIPNGGDATVTSTKRYLQVTSIVIPVQSGTSGTFTVGTRAPVTAVGSSGTKVVCTSAAGELHSFERVTADNLLLKDQTANPGIATDLNAIQDANDDWYGLVLDSQGAAEVAAAAAWIETAKKLCAVQTSDTDMLASGSFTCLGYTLKNAGYTRTTLWFHPKLGTTDSLAAAAIMGEEFPKLPGASKWSFKDLAGIASYALTTTQRTGVESYNANHYLEAGGLPITYPGKVSSGEWVDVVRDLDWLTARLKERQLAVQVANDKVPFTDGGIALLLAEVRAQLTDGVEAGVLAASPVPTATAPRASAVSSANKAARNLPGVTFQATLAGSINTIVIRGRVAV